MIQTQRYDTQVFIAGSWAFFFAWAVIFRSTNIIIASTIASLLFGGFLGVWLIDFMRSRK